MIFKYIYNQPLFFRRIILLVIDTICIFISLNLSLKSSNSISLTHYILIIFITLITYSFTGNYQNITKYNNNIYILNLSLRNIFIVFILSISDYFFYKSLVLENLSFVVFILINISLSFISRVLIKDLIYKLDISSTANKKNAIIYGAGMAGAILSNSIDIAKFKVFYFVDDDEKIINRKNNGILIKPVKELPYLINKFKIDTIILAIPSLKEERKKQILLQLNKYRLNILQVPNLSDINSEITNINKLKPIRIGDLLGREIAKPDKFLMNKDVNKSTVCITGAGGSIGSELCRQIINLNPKKIILIDQSEFNLFQIEEELKNIIPKEIKPLFILTRVQNYNFLKKIFLSEKVDIIFHTSAYKHVHLVEKNPLEGISNNVRSSETICKIAFELGISKVVLISSDKAVRPKNIMGVSKRISELIFQAYNQKTKEVNSSNQSTIFTMVRFGNVLDSSGSVVPKFRSQIKKGGPITLTSKKVIRYFMTIEEAAQLVIQSASLAKGGEVFLLDMGNPVKIFDLAKQMILLSGKTIKDDNNKKGDIEILITGLKEGEKLYEELLINATSRKTDHPLIFCANENSIPFKDLQLKLNLLNEALEDLNEKETFKILKSLVSQWDK